MTTLKELRKDRNLSLEAFAVLSGTDIATISRVELGLQVPRPDTIVKLARGLGIGALRMAAILQHPEDVPGEGAA